MGKRPGFPHGRGGGGRHRHDQPRLCQRTRLIPAARQDRRREGKGRRLAPAGHRNPLRRPEGQAHRADRRADWREEASDPRRRAGRKRRAGPADPRAARTDGRQRPPARKPLSPHRPRDPLPAQSQRAGFGAHAGGDESQGGAHRLARLPDRSAGAAGAGPRRQDRRPAGAARRFPNRLPQPRPGDRDHPHRG